MFTKPLEYIFLPSALKDAYDEINKAASGIVKSDIDNFFETKVFKNFISLFGKRENSSSAH